MLAADDGRASAERGQQPTGVEHLRVCWVPGAPADVPFITITFANAQRASLYIYKTIFIFRVPLLLLFSVLFCFFLLFSADRLLFFGVFFLVLVCSAVVVCSAF